MLFIGKKWVFSRAIRNCARIQVKGLKVHESPHVTKICRFWVHETPHEGQVKRIKDIPA
jgi:hypothetical protein